jgi:hypothetical protein
MGMMDAAANALLQRYFEALVKKGHRPLKCSENYAQVRNLEHIAWMCREAQTFTDAEKKHRWIGFIQGTLWFDGLVSIDDLKRDVIAALDETRAFEEVLP